MTTAAGDYHFPISKLRPAGGDASTSGEGSHGTQPVVLVACGSFNPPTIMHMRMFELAAAALEKSGRQVLGAYMSPVGDAYGKKGLAPGRDRVAMCEAAAAAAPLVMVDAWEALQEGYTRTLAVLRHVQQELRQHCLAEVQQPQLLLLCGADVLASMAIPGVWRDPELLLQEFGVVCLTRQGTDLDQLLGVEAETGGGRGSVPGPEQWGGVASSEEGQDGGAGAEAAQKAEEARQLRAMLRRQRDRITLVELPPEHSDIGSLSSSQVRARLQAGQPIAGLVPEPVEQYIRQHGLYAD